MKPTTSITTLFLIMSFLILCIAPSTSLVAAAGGHSPASAHIRHRVRAATVPARKEARIIGLLTGNKGEKQKQGGAKKPEEDGKKHGKPNKSTGPSRLQSSDSTTSSGPATAPDSSSLAADPAAAEPAPVSQGNAVPSCERCAWMNNAAMDY